MAPHNRQGVESASGRKRAHSPSRVVLGLRRRLATDCDPEQEELICFVELFAGIGGSASGFVRAGWVCLLLVECRRELHATLRELFPKVQIACDVNHLYWLPQRTNVLFGGFPCGDLSTNGVQAGLTDGTSSNLVRKQIVLAADCPGLRYLALENVPGMLTRPRSRPGQPRGEAPIYTIVELLRDAGFKWAWREYTLVEFGVPQERVRILILASKVHDPRPVLFGRNGVALEHGTGADMSPEYMPRQVVESQPVYVFDISTGRDHASVWHPFAHTITRSMKLIVVLADGTMGEMLIGDLEVISGVRRGHTHLQSLSTRKLVLAESCASNLTYAMANRINLGEECGEYEGALGDEVLERGDDTPQAAWGGFGEHPGEMRRVVGQLLAVGFPRQTLSDVITGAGRLPTVEEIKKWCKRVRMEDMPPHVVRALQAHGYMEAEPPSRRRGNRCTTPLSAVLATGTRVHAARYTGPGFKSVFSMAVVQSAEAMVRPARHHDERLVLVKFDEDGCVHKVPHNLVFALDARPTGCDEGHALKATHPPLFDLQATACGECNMCTGPTRCSRTSSRPCRLKQARDLAAEGSFGGCLSIAGDKAVGVFVDIYWPNEQMWMSAEITGFDANTGLHSVDYLDGQVLDDSAHALWRERVRLSAGAPTEGHEAAAKPGGHGWYPGKVVIAVEAAMEAATSARAERMADGARLVQQALRDGVEFADLMKTIQGNEALRSTAMGSVKGAKMLAELVLRAQRQRETEECA